MMSLLFFDVRVFILSILHNSLTLMYGDNVDANVEILLTIAKGFQPLIINIKRSILDFASVLDPPLNTIEKL